MVERDWVELPINLKFKVQSLNWHKWDKDCPQCWIGKDHLIINGYVDEEKE